MSAGVAAVGRALRRSAAELTRVWRLARAQARRDVFPGMLDGLLPGFLDEAGRLMAAEGAPEDAWAAAGGVLRLGPGDSSGELTVEWALAMEVLAAACESFHASPAAAEWLARAVAAAERGTSAAAAAAEPDALPPGVLIVRWVRVGASRSRGGAAAAGRG
jgi:hypothetical protein